MNLKQLALLNAVATPGPWHIRRMDDDLCCGALAVATTPDGDDNAPLSDGQLHGVLAATLIQHRDYVVPTDGRSRENAELIAAMRNALPELLRLARLGAEAELAKTALPPSPAKAGAQH